MPYTFYHCGVLIGKSKLEDRNGNPRWRGGIFWPTPHGLELFPRLTGILTAGLALKAHMEAHGLHEDTMDKAEVVDLLDNTPAGQKIIDIGRTLSDVEVRAPDGRRLEWVSIGFNDMNEWRAISGEDSPDGIEKKAELPADGPRFLVSATFKHHAYGRPTVRPWRA
jgi:hypothetical protein